MRISFTRLRMCMLAIGHNLSQKQNENSKFNNKRPVSNGIRLKRNKPNPKRNRALLILLCRMKC